MMSGKIIIYLLLMATVIVNSRILRDEKSEKLDKLRMTPSTFDKMKNLHKNTYYTAVKAIIGKLGNILYKELPFSEKRLLAKCLDKVEDRRELIEPAKCVVTARKRLLKIKAVLTQKHLEATTPYPNRNWKAFLQQFDDFDRLQGFSPVFNKKERFLNSKSQDGVFKEKASYSKGSQIYWHNPSSTKSKLAFVQEVNHTPELPSPPDAKRLEKMRKKLISTKTFKNSYGIFKSKKTAFSRRFSNTNFRQKRNSFRFPDSKEHYYSDQKFKVVTRKELKTLTSKSDENPLILSITKTIREMIKRSSTGAEGLPTGKEDEEVGKEHLKWTKTYNRLMRVRKAIDEQKKIPGAKVYEHRMYDIVLDRDEASLSPSERRSTSGIMHESMKLLHRLTSTSNDTAPSYRALSPRFMPLMPLNEGNKQPGSFLSPTIMAMYDEPHGKSNDRSIANVPKILRSLGISGTDRNRIMQLVMDLSGSKTHVDEALKIYENLGMFDDEVAEPLLNATEKIIGAFKNLENSLFPNQKFLYDTRGFAFLKKHQLQRLLRDHGNTDDELDLADFDIYDQMTDEQMELSLWKTVESIAANKTNVLRPSGIAKRRRKRDYIFFLQPTVLSPFMFTVQRGVSILGPLILSPTAFAPPILNPSILSPWILSPGVFDPFILSPYMFCPFILGPLAFTPFILTPYMFSPNILTPYLATSLILSPIGLSPDILSPMAIGANVLSPSFLSPPVMTPTVLTSSVLSPSFLS